MTRLVRWLSADGHDVRTAGWVAVVMVPSACAAVLATTLVGSAASLSVDGGVVQVFVLEQQQDTGPPAAEPVEPVEPERLAPEGRPGPAATTSTPDDNPPTAAAP